MAVLCAGLSLGYGGVGIAAAGSASTGKLATSAEWDEAAWLASLSEEHRNVVLHPVTAELPEDLRVRARPQPSRTDTGTTADIAIAKSEVRRLKVADAELSALPQDRDAQRAAIADGRSARASRTAELWAAHRVEEQSVLLERGLAELSEDAGYTAYSDADFVVEQWQGVQADRRSVYAQVLGHMRYRTYKFGWVQDRALQYQFHLIWADSSRTRLKLDSWAAVRVPTDAAGE